MPARKTTPPSEISFYGLLMWRGKEYPYETLLFNWQSGQYFILGPGPLKQLEWPWKFQIHAEFFFSLTHFSN